jgi:hypothetical protein
MELDIGMHTLCALPMAQKEIRKIMATSLLMALEFCPSIILQKLAAE